MRRVFSALALLAALGAVFAGERMLTHNPTAEAANVVSINPSSGGSGTQFNFLLPTSAACPNPSSNANGDKLDSFVLDNSLFPAGSLGSLHWDVASSTWTLASGGASQSAFGVLFTGGGAGGGSPYTNQATLPVTGQIAPVSFGWPPNDFGANAAAGLDLYPGTFNVGIACITSAGAVDAGNFWNLQIALTASSSDPGGFTWVLSSFPTAVSLSASPANQATPGASVTLTATVSPSDAKGTVTFYNGSTAVGAPQQVAVANGVATATLVTGSLPVGTDPLKATFNPLDYSSTGQGTNVYSASTSTVMNYTISSSASTATTAPGLGSGGGSGDGTGSSGGSSTGTPGSGTGDAGGASGGGATLTGTGSSGISGLPATGKSVYGAVLFAAGVAYIGLFLLSFSIPTVPRRQKA